MSKGAKQAPRTHEKKTGTRSVCKQLAPVPQKPTWVRRRPTMEDGKINQISRSNQKPQRVNLREDVQRWRSAVIQDSSLHIVSIFGSDTNLKGNCTGTPAGTITYS